MADDCIFCMIIAGTIPADLVDQSEDIIAFRDINPKAPVHVLVVPKVHSPDIASLSATDPQIAAELLAMTRHVAQAEGVDDYNLVFNTGAAAGQTVFHAHGHVLGGVDASKLFLA